MKCVSLIAAACLLVAGHATSPEEVDTSVSSAIANTMDTILGRSHASRKPSSPVMPRRKLGLSKVRNQAVHHFAVKSKKWVMPKADAPKQLSGYLGWAKK